MSDLDAVTRDGKALQVALTLPNVALLVAAVVGIVSLTAFVTSLGTDVGELERYVKGSVSTDLDTLRLRTLRLEWMLQQSLARQR